MIAEHILVIFLIALVIYQEVAWRVREYRLLKETAAVSLAIHETLQTRLMNKLKKFHLIEQWQDKEQDAY